MVVKVGTNVVTGRDGRLDRRVLLRLARQMVAVRNAGIDLSLVASGAIGAGMGELELPERPRDLPHLQAVAAVGQARLVRMFNEVFRKHGLHAAQLLLTRDDFENRTRYLNIRNTIRALHDLGAVPIINENDTVGIDEIRYGDNDIIAAMVANLLRADLLILLSAVDGLIVRTPDGKAGVVDLVKRIDRKVTSLVDGTRSSLGAGGMGAKLEAIRMVTKAGEVAVIANGKRPNVISHILNGEKIGTLFLPHPSKLSAKRRWIGMSVRPRGRIIIDTGAAKALMRSGRSLLTIGITGVEGQFRKGDVVCIVGPEGRELARGLVNYNVRDLLRIKGLRSDRIASELGQKLYDEAVHRDNMTILGK